MSEVLEKKVTTKMTALSSVLAKHWFLRHMKKVKFGKQDVRVQRCDNLLNVYLVVASTSLGPTMADPNLHLGYLVWLDKDGYITYCGVLDPTDHDSSNSYTYIEVDEFVAKGENLVIQYHQHNTSRVRERRCRLWNVTHNLYGYKGE